MKTLNAVKFGFTLFEIAEHMEPALLSVVEKFEAANGHRPTVADVAPEIANTDHRGREGSGHRRVADLMLRNGS